MKKLFLFFSFFIFFTPFSFSSVPAFQVAQESSVFADSDLEGIEDSNTRDEEIEEAFNSFSEGNTEDNFDEEDFDEEDFDEEDFDEGDFDEKKKSKSPIDMYNEKELEKNDYEAISENLDYEISDKKLESKFKQESKKEVKKQPRQKKKGELKNLIKKSIQKEPQETDSFIQEELQDVGTKNEEGSFLQEELQDIGTEDEGTDFFLENSSSLNRITNIRYISSKDQIIIDCSEPTSYQVRTNEKTNQFIIEILQAKLADNLHWPYVLRDFNTQFGLIKADQKDANTVRIIIQLKEGAHFPQSVLTEKGNQILVAYGKIVEHEIIGTKDLSFQSKRPILPAKTLEDLYLGNLQFSGSPISFHVIDAPIKQVLRFISEESGLNMVIGESVQGTVTLKLEDVPWDQALHTIFKVKSLGYTRDGNVITILPLSEIEERTRNLKIISDRQRSLSVFETKVIPISYGQLSNIHDEVKEFSTPGSDYSRPGKIITHIESNTLIVIDTAEIIKKIESLIQYLDQPPKQVMIEARIVEVAKNFSKNLGLNWGLGGNLPVTINASGLLELIGNIGGSYSGRFNSGSGVASLNINGLPIIGDINASLDLAEAEGYAQVVSSPKVTVTSGKQASITRNAPILIPRTTTTTNTPDGNTSDQSSFESVDVAISLNVTPTVTSTGSVFLQVNITKTDPGPGAGTVGQAVTLNRSAQTEILAKNGQTVVIGGIYEKSEVGGSTGIPFFKNIPFLNMLFSRQSNSHTNSELLIFITPKLLDHHE